jgi:hypothetical protein
VYYWEASWIADWKETTLKIKTLMKSANGHVVIRVGEFRCTLVGIG